MAVLEQASQNSFMLPKKQIELTIPTLDLSLLRKIKGGYSPDDYFDVDNGRIYGHDNYNPDDGSYDLGELDGGVCKPTEPVIDIEPDEECPEYEDPEFIEQSDYEDYGDVDHGQNGYDGFNFNNGYTIDPSLSVEERAIITSAMEALPLALQMQNVRIVVDAHTIEQLNPYKAQHADFDILGGNACFLYKGQVVTIDGNRVTIQEDTIFLRDANVASQALLEESFHLWQHYNCIQTPFVYSSDFVVDGMELQADIIKNMMLFQVGHEIMLNDDLAMAIIDAFDQQTHQYDIESLTSFFDSYFTPPSGYDFCWDTVLTMFFEHSYLPFQ